MSAVLDAYGGISSPRLAGKLREFQRTAARIDNRAARDCAERMHETVRGSIE
ncbi:hypothetical protein AB0N81_37830 [Streptomyces sp. NPDC093510]|uniref:hypothetical protein n=1 Tax=Streptomyces sp. NPDC093510 TaxID=3155199 RepID=UPI00344864EA